MIRHLTWIIGLSVGFVALCFFAVGGFNYTWACFDESCPWPIYLIAFVGALLFAVIGPIAVPVVRFLLSVLG